MSLSIKEPELLAEVVNPRAGPGEYRIGLEHLTVSSSKEVPRDWWGYAKGTQGASMGSPLGQIWDCSSNIRRVMDYNLLNQVRTQEPTLI